MRGSVYGFTLEIYFTVKKQQPLYLYKWLLRFLFVFTIPIKCEGCRVVPFHEPPFS